jgi:hypothetical protein
MPFVMVAALPLGGAGRQLASSPVPYWRAYGR